MGKLGEVLSHPNEIIPLVRPHCGWREREVARSLQ
jgi:hypothetical protein